MPRTAKKGTKNTAAKAAAPPQPAGPLFQQPAPRFKVGDIVQHTSDVGSTKPIGYTVEDNVWNGTTYWVEITYNGKVYSVPESTLIHLYTPKPQPAQPEAPKKPERTLKILNWKKEERAGLLFLCENGTYADVYAVACGEGQNVLFFSKVQAGAASVNVARPYTVVLNAARSGGSCQCKGKTNHGYCRHVSAALALVAKYTL